jgi:hypothetical protein
MKTKLSILFLCGALLTISCKKDNNTPKDTGTNKVVTGNGEVTITGNSDYEFSMALEKATYVVTYKEKAKGSLTNYQINIAVLGGWTSLMPLSFKALRDTGWYEGSVVTESTSANTFQYKVFASGSYQIRYQKLPLPKTSETLPKTYTGAGGTVFGPVSIAASPIFTIVCSDAKQAGFTVTLFNATTGEEMYSAGYKPLYMNLDNNNKVINNINTTVTPTLATGNYLIEVEANQDATYSILVQ